jgi:hypothetical protein
LFWVVIDCMKFSKCASNAFMTMWTTSDLELFHQLL